MTACYHSVQRLFSSSSLSKNINSRIYRAIILRVVLYGCETWPVTLWEEYRLKVFNNRLVDNILGPNRDEITVEWRKIRNGEQILLFGWSDLDRMRWLGHVARMVDRRRSYRILVGKSEVKRPLGRPRLSWRIILKWIFRKRDRTWNDVA